MGSLQRAAAVVTALLDMGADVDIAENGKTSLMLAASEGHTAVVNALLKAVLISMRRINKVIQH